MSGEKTQRFQNSAGGGGRIVTIGEGITVHVSGFRVVVVGEDADAVAAIITPAELIHFAKGREDNSVGAVGVMTFAIESPR